MRVLVLIDGEPYPPVTRRGVDAVRAERDDVVAALLLGGAEKLREGVELALGTRGPAGSAGGGGGLARRLTAPRARPGGRPCRLRLPGGRHDNRRDDRRRPAVRRRARRQALREQRGGGCPDRGRPRARGRDPRG